MIKRIHLYALIFSLLNGILYSVIAVLGIKNLEQIFNFKNTSIFYLISIGSIICYSAFSYKFFESMSLKPTSFLSWILLFLSPIAASSFLSAGIQGASQLNLFNNETCIIIGILLFFFRTLNLIDGSVKLPERLTLIKTGFANGFKKGNHNVLVANVIILYTAIGYSLSSTDAIYTAVITICRWINCTNAHYVTCVGFIGSIIGALVSFPMFLYWIQRGISQLLNFGTPDIRGIIVDPTDKFTYIALFFSLPVILGALGAATGINAEVFGKLGTPAVVVRVSSAILFAITASIPGLSTLLRHFKIKSFVINRRENEYSC